MSTIHLSHGSRLLSGAMMDYLHPEDCDATIDDIASGLSNVCRFAGQLPCFYSVAQHSVNVSRIVAADLAFDALMHDTAEAFTNDLPTPLKVAFPVFKDLEVKIESAMSKLFGFSYPLSPEIKLADSQMLGLEKVYIKQDYSHWSMLDGIEFEHLRAKVDLGSWHPYYAKARFLERYEELRP